MKEIEAKIAIKNINFLQQETIIKEKEVHVLDIYYDNEFIQFSKKDKVMRLRKENDKTYIAYKGKQEDHQNLIVREEIETEIESYEKTLRILKELKLTPVAKVEKARTYYTSTKHPSLSITLDQYPFIGDYLEVEGEEQEVYSFMKENDLNIEEATQKNCTALFLKYCEEKKLPFTNPQMHFTFADEKKVKQG